MKICLFIWSFVCCLILQAQSTSTISIVSFNVENLFDTLDDVTNLGDNEFLPEGELKWSKKRYLKKLANLDYMFSSIENLGIIGLCEIENRTVLEDLIQQNGLAKYKWSIYHRDSPDSRGIDVAILVRNDIADSVKIEWIYPRIAIDSNFSTREIAFASIYFGQTPLYIAMNHWPSRSGGQEQSDYKRLEVARYLKSYMTISRINPDKSHILLMGDFNDYASNSSVQEFIANENSWYLASKLNSSDTIAYPINGSYKYKNEWNFIDHGILSVSLLRSKFVSSSGKKSINPIRFLSKQSRLLYLPKTPFFPGTLIEENPKYGTGLTNNRLYYGKFYNGGISDHSALVFNIKIRK